MSEVANHVMPIIPVWLPVFLATGVLKVEEDRFRIRVFLALLITVFNYPELRLHCSWNCPLCRLHKTVFCLPSGLCECRSPRSIMNHAVTQNRLMMWFNENTCFQKCAYAHVFFSSRLSSLLWQIQTEVVLQNPIIIYLIMMHPQPIRGTSWRIEII